MSASEGFAPRLSLAAGLVGAIVLVAACSSAGGASTAPSSAPSTAPSVAASAEPSTSAAAGGKGGYGGGDYGTASASPAASTASGGETYTIAVASSSLGKFLTGEDGKTLYTFKADAANTSNCGPGACADNWPALFVDSSDTLKAGAGVTGKLTTFTRSDGKMQAAYNGAPLYYFIGDSKAGDTNGQGIANKWYVAAP
jgi:predicted lipoprotein with Yx(FWY)xxD motif